MIKAGDHLEHPLPGMLVPSAGHHRIGWQKEAGQAARQGLPAAEERQPPRQVVRQVRGSAEGRQARPAAVGPCEKAVKEALVEALGQVRDRT
jgi:hypothetical protein